ncbi:unnamed protein product [Coffea canephora]|uniref:Uncharacterized protein n=1 Tax=Coffea canephora TaxID=49390 RepID=A0A068UHX7_COFCA|nr:unnamed protein product [Coffea canephora]
MTAGILLCGSICTDKKRKAVSVKLLLDMKMKQRTRKGFKSGGQLLLKLLLSLAGMFPKLPMGKVTSFVLQKFELAYLLFRPVVGYLVMIF